MEKNVKILVCCHKMDVMANNTPYFPIHVGKAIAQFDLGISGDDTGDNISSKNSSYCELTGLYWAWKNLKDVDVIGLCHYRRYFDFHNQCPSILPHKIIPVSAFADVNLSVPEDIISRVVQGDVVIAKPVVFPYSLYLDFCEQHYSDDLRVMQQVVRQTQSEAVKQSFYKVMIKGNQLSPCNMFLMNWSDFDKYCTWLFDLLGKIEEQIDISKYNNVQKRVYGYMAERLLNVWLLANGKTIIRKPILKIDDQKDVSRGRHAWYFWFSRWYRGLLNRLVNKMSYQQWVKEDPNPYYMKTSL